MDKLDILEYLKEIEEQCADLECYDCKYEELCWLMALGCPCKMYKELQELLSFESIKGANNEKNI